MPQRICIVGNSMIAALLAAHRAYGAEDWRHDFDFFGSEAGSFSQIRIGEGYIGQARFKSNNASNNLADYDGFVVYADLVAPHFAARLDGHLRQAGHSTQLRRAALHDIVAQRLAFGAVQRLLQAVRVPVFALTRNITIKDPPLDEPQYRQAIELLRDMLAPAQLIETPASLLQAGFIADPRYNKGSIFDGKGQAASDPECDVTHLNLEGGRIMLHHIAATISARFASS